MIGKSQTTNPRHILLGAGLAAGILGMLVFGDLIVEHAIRMQAPLNCPVKCDDGHHQWCPTSDGVCYAR